MLSDFLRFYPSYKAADVGRLSRRQFNALIRAAYKRPWSWSVMVEPK